MGGQVGVGAFCLPILEPMLGPKWKSNRLVKRICVPRGSWRSLGVEFRIFWCHFGGPNPCKTHALGRRKSRHELSRLWCGGEAAINEFQKLGNRLKNKLPGGRSSFRPQRKQRKPGTQKERPEATRVRKMLLAEAENERTSVKKQLE